MLPGRPSHDVVRGLPWFPHRPPPPARPLGSLIAAAWRCNFERPDNTCGPTWPPFPSDDANTPFHQGSSPPSSRNDPKRKQSRPSQQRPPPLNPFRKVPSPTPSHLHLTSWQGRSRARAHGRLHLSEQVRLSKRGSRLFLPQRHPTEAPSSSVIHEGIVAPMASISGGCLASCGTCRCGCSWEKKDQFVPPLRGHGKFHGPAWALRGAEREWRPAWNIEQS